MRTRDEIAQAARSQNVYPLILEVLLDLRERQETVIDLLEDLRELLPAPPAPRQSAVTQDEHERMVNAERSSPGVVVVKDQS